MFRRPVIGQPAPDFELTVHGTEGATWSLRDHLSDQVGDHASAQPVVLIFHRHSH